MKIFCVNKKIDKSKSSIFILIAFLSTINLNVINVSLKKKRAKMQVVLPVGSALISGSIECISDSNPVADEELFIPLGQCSQVSFSFNQFFDC
jgi:hypothetical protein